jgi:hypothetical protein
MTLKIGEKELNVKFGYEATLKSRLLSKMAKMGVKTHDKGGDMEVIEDMLLFIPEVLLVGLQKEHKKEFGYNLDTKEGYEENKEKVFGLVAEYLDSGDVDAIDLFNELQEEMTRNGFLKKMFEREVEKATEQANTKN